MLVSGSLRDDISKPASAPAEFANAPRQELIDPPMLRALLAGLPQWLLLHKVNAAKMSSLSFDALTVHGFCAGKCMRIASKSLLPLQAATHVLELTGFEVLQTS